MVQGKQDIAQNTDATLTHGLLAEDFRQNLLALVQGHQLDIQTKAIILDSVLLAANMAAEQQTQIELEEYRKGHGSNTPPGKETPYRCFFFDI